MRLAMVTNRRFPSRGAFAILSLVASVAVAVCGGAMAASPSVESGNGAAAVVSPVPDESVDDGGADLASGSGGTGTVLEQTGGLCKYVPLELAEQALGGSPTDAQADASSLGMGHSCRITLDTDTVLDVERSGVETVDEFKDSFETVGTAQETVAGLGELGYRAEGTALGGAGARLTVFTGDHHLAVTITATGDQQAQFTVAEQIVKALTAVGL
jgi:hypothetical protein